MSRRKPSDEQPATLDVSRRGFLKGASALAAAPLLIPQIATAQAPPADGLKRAGPGETACELKINGKAHPVKIEPRQTLLDVLRDKLDLTGSKEICSRGACGGCTVLIDGLPVNSCLTLAIDAAGSEITTVEGLAKGEQLDPVQAAFVKHDAQQCGYCTPGLIMSVRALLNDQPKPTLMQVREACAGNICRCGTYTKVFEAALAASGATVPVGNIADNAGKAWENDGPRVDAPLKVTGKAKYTADLNLPNMAHATVLYCPHGKAKLKSFDEEAAKKIPGVLDVSVKKLEEFVYCGQPAGHICAENRQALDDAVAALKLKWDVLTPVVDPIAEHERVAGPIPSPIEKARATRRDADADEVRKAVKEAFEKGHRVVERTYSTPMQTHVSLEPHCAVADFRGDTAELWCSSQATQVIHGEAASAFGLERSQVKAHCEFTGGGFGSKFSIDTEGRLAADLSKKLRRPIKVVNSRKREHLDTGCRPGSIQYMKFALDDKGELLGGHVHIAGVSGAGGGGDATNPSRYKLGQVVKSMVDLELTVGGARPMRAPGHPQGMFAVDSFVDELAEAAGVDPLDFRKKIDPSPVRLKMYDVGAERIGWKSRTAAAAAKGSKRRGIGMGVADWGNGEGNARIGITVFKDGTVRVLSGTQDMGNGTRTVLVDTTAKHLGIERRLVSADCGNSEYPPGPPSGGSVTTRTIVPAIRDAAQKAKDELKKVANADYNDTASWIAACKRMPEESFAVVGKFNKEYWGSGGSEAVQFAEVEVDIETGEVRVLKVVALQACGRPVNRLTVESQICGGVIQGTSFALFEEKTLDPKTGAMVNPNMEMYKILGPVDCPEIVPIIWAEGDDLGARSIGEPPIVPTAGAIANAVANAIGARVRSLPITPARVLAALAEKGGVA